MVARPLFLFVFNSIGMVPGPMAVALLTGSLYADSAKPGLSLATVMGVPGPLATLLFACGLGPARRAIDPAGDGPAAAA